MYEFAHLLFPLLSSVLFVVGAMFAQQVTSRGGSPYTTTATANMCLAACWLVVGLIRGEWLSLSEGMPALLIAAAFVVGQLCTYLAFRWGDVSLATPVFGVKIIMVAFISSMLAETPVENRLWTAAVVAAVGIGVIQSGTGSAAHPRLTPRRAALAILLALTAAAALSIFDVGLQAYGRRYGALRFLTTMFVAVGLLSGCLLPWTDGIHRLREKNAVRPLGLAALFMAVQAISISYALGQFGDATRVNIVYSLRGLWSVLLAWWVGKYVASIEHTMPRSTFLFRLTGALLLTLAVLIALL